MSVKFTDYAAYQFNGIYSFITDTGGTPFVAINETAISNPVIRSFAKNGSVVLNIGQVSCKLDITTEGIAFEGRFGGVLQSDFFYWEDILLVFDREQKYPAFSLLVHPALKTSGPIEPVIARPKLSVVPVINS